MKEKGIQHDTKGNLSKEELRSKTIKRLVIIGLFLGFVLLIILIMMSIGDGINAGIREGIR